MNAVARIVAAALVAGTLGLAPRTSMPDFSEGTGWINSSGLRPADLQGKVVLVDFWEYTCVNCLRTLPYLRAWYARYRDDGFVIVGVHTPEFGFSGDDGNVESATKRLGITWPVVVDRDDRIWRRYGNASWPTEYLFDQDGELVDTVSGEGDYEQTERRIQALLTARDHKLSLPPVMALLPQDAYTRPGAVCYSSTREVLLGRVRIADAPVDRRAGDAYVDDGVAHPDGAIFLQGTWHQTSDGAFSGAGPRYVDLRYHAIQVVSVLSAKGGPERVDVTEDGAPVPRIDAGADLRYDAAGASYVIVDAPRAYDLVMNAKIGSHDLRLTPSGGESVGVYSFAFESCVANPA